MVMGVNFQQEIETDKIMTDILIIIRESYKHNNIIDKIPKAIKSSNISSKETKDYFSLGSHKQFPYELLDSDPQIFGWGKISKGIINKENEIIVNTITNECKVNKVDKVDFGRLFNDTYKKMRHIHAIFCPINFIDQIYYDLDSKAMAHTPYEIDTGVDNIKIIYSNKYSKWNEIIFLGKDSISWSRKLNPLLPPNVQDYKIITKPNDYFQMAYTFKEIDPRFYTGITCKCETIKKENIMVYSK